MTISPLAPDQTIAQMWSNGVWGGGKYHRNDTFPLVKWTWRYV